MRTSTISQMSNCYKVLHWSVIRFCRPRVFIIIRNIKEYTCFYYNITQTKIQNYTMCLYMSKSTATPVPRWLGGQCCELHNRRAAGWYRLESRRQRLFRGAKKILISMRVKIKYVAVKHGIRGICWDELDLNDFFQYNLERATVILVWAVIRLQVLPYRRRAVS